MVILKRKTVAENANIYNTNAYQESGFYLISYKGKKEKPHVVFYSAENDLIVYIGMTTDVPELVDDLEDIGNLILNRPDVLPPGKPDPDPAPLRPVVGVSESLFLKTLALVKGESYKDIVK